MPDRPFTDIDTHWAQSCILALAQQGIVSGYPDGRFLPDATMSRAEFTALMRKAFPNAPAIRQPIEFPDVPSSHWAYTVIQWGYARGFVSGFYDGSFQPNQPITRLQVLLVLVSAAQVTAPPDPNSLLSVYFSDAASVPHWAKGATAAAIQANLVVNYPDVRQLRPNANATRAEVCAFVCRVLNLASVVPVQYATWSWGIYDLKGEVKVPFVQWKGSGRLMRDIQVLLTNFGLYPGGTLINGEYNWQTEKALTTFCNFYGLNTMQTGVFDETFAWTLLNADPLDYSLAVAKDRQKIYNEFLQQEAGYDALKLAFLDRGIQNSPYNDDVKFYPTWLQQQPDGAQLVSLGNQITLTGTNQLVTFSPYPVRGSRPTIAGGLEFLHSDIIQACLCVGSVVNGKVNVNWRGRDALKAAQQWSTTKFLPLLNVVCRANASLPTAKVQDDLVRSRGGSSGYGFYNLAVELVNYASSIASSNSIAAMFKQFSHPTELESWVIAITGNPNLEFRGRYGEPALFDAPELYHQPSGRVVLTAPTTSHTGNNLISTYDLTRFISMLGWHNYLAQEAKLPAAQWSSLDAVVRAMGMDTARYLDVAIDRLGLSRIMESPVILSKLGFGRSSSRNRTELGYVALLQFIDTRGRAKGQPAVLRMVSLALLAAKGLNDANEEARQLDARVAAEVTEILRRIMTQELA